MRLAALILAGLFLGPAAARAHEDGREGRDQGEGHHMPANHAKKGEHKDAPTSFAKQPAAGTWAKCPVSGDIFRVTKRTTFATYAGRTWAFCCDECKPDFDADPAKYAKGLEPR